MLSDEEKKELQELINLLYNNHLSQYGKRKLETYIKKQQKEIEELKEKNKKYIVQLTDEQYRKLVDVIRNEISKDWEDKIKAKIEEIKERPNKMVIDKEIPEEYKNIFLDENAILVLQSLLEKE